MPVNAEQIRQLMTELTDQDDSSDEDETPVPQRSGRSAARGLGSNSSSISAEAKGAAAGKQERSKQARHKNRVESRITFLRKVHGGSLPPVNDQAPDPGCAYEGRFYLQYRDPTFFPRRKAGLQVGVNVLLPSSIITLLFAVHQYIVVALHAGPRARGCSELKVVWQLTWGPALYCIVRQPAICQQAEASLQTKEASHTYWCT
jgi:hypothetical protein